MQRGTVVRVLEAVHLLLAFPLFVVIVGVDPRWLNNALNDQYKTLLGIPGENRKTDKSKTQQDSANNGQSAEEREEDKILAGAATTFDYLEKIFQIPFTLKPIARDSKGALLRSLVAVDLDPTDSGNTADEGQSQSSLNGEAGQEEVNAASQSTFTQTSDGQENGSTATTTSTSPSTVEERIVNGALKITAAELRYMNDISDIYGHTPRTIYRYVNIYRIIKSHNSFKVTDTFSETDFIPVMVLLSVVVGHSIFAQTFINQIEKIDKKTAAQFSMGDFLDTSSLPKSLKSILLGKEETKGIGDAAMKLTMDRYKANLDLVSRFSFRTIKFQSTLEESNT